MLLDQENQDDYFWADSAYRVSILRICLALVAFKFEPMKSDHAITFLASQQRAVLNIQSELA